MPLQAGGFGFSQLWLTQGDAFMTSPELITDPNGDLWTLDQRLELAQMASTAYFATLLHIRVWVLLTCKTVERSLFKHGMLRCVDMATVTRQHPTTHCTRTARRPPRQQDASDWVGADHPHPTRPVVRPGHPMAVPHGPAPLVWAIRYNHPHEPINKQQAAAPV
jgi:hypothetical protein